MTTLKQRSEAQQSSAISNDTTLLPRWMMADPLKVLLSKEAAELKRTCTGCSHAAERVSPFGEPVMRCLKGKPYGKKCSQFVGGESK
ncbi:hypothetical protein [Bordetella sp. 15P40C-2]|uniref:hypothetical protein n=1 Tax=Bordetella sp. 15P40C-2 TaxID=2572246 RepID=UPI001F1619BB|nr:hypothetical protein [Bordetella sp. 15P40C-2]